jgi:hypothetical protein
MTTFTAFEASGGVSVSDPTNPALGGKDTNSTTADSIIPSAALAGTHADNFPPSPEPHDAQVGFEADSFGFLHWYNRIHVTPLTLALGNLISSQVREISLFSTYFVDRTLNDVTLGNGDGLVLTEPAATPLTLAPWQELIYELAISTDGPPTIDATILFDTDVIDITVEITGVRIVAWHFAPNWVDPVRESLTWLTDVQRAESGAEQRFSLREGPRQGWSFTFDCAGRLRRTLESELFAWGSRIWVLPIWPDIVEIAAPLTAGATSIPLTTAIRDYHVGGLGLLLSGDGLSYESFEVDTVAADSITLARPLLNSWPVGTACYPARQARLTGTQGLGRFTTDLATGSADFETVEQITVTYTAESLYRGLPVLEHEPNWRDQPGLAYRRQLDVLDNLTGALLVQDRSGLAEPAQTMLWSAFDRTEIAALRKFLWARRGRWRGIWVPTFASDLKLVDTIAPSAVNIDVENVGLTQFVAADVGRQDIRIELVDGTIYYRRVSAFALVDADTERMTLSTALGATITPAAVRRISWMMFARLDDDLVEIEWVSASVAEATVTLTGPRNAH